MGKVEENVELNKYKNEQNISSIETKQLILGGGTLLEKVVERLLDEVAAEFLQLSKVGDRMLTVAGLSWCRRSEGDDPPVACGAAFY